MQEEGAGPPGVIEAMASQYQDLVEGFGKQTSTLADHAARAVAEVSALHSGILEKHEGDREQMRKAWGVEQGRQQLQFDALLEKMREDLDDRRRSGAEQVANLNAWAHQLIKRVDSGSPTRPRAGTRSSPSSSRRWPRPPRPCIKGTRTHARIKEIAQILADADRHRGEELGRLIMALRESNDGARPVITQ